MPSVSALQFAVPGASAAGSAALPLESGVSYVAAIGTLGAAPVAEARVAKLVVVPQPAEKVAEKPPEPPVEVDIEATRRPTPEQIIAPSVAAKPAAADKPAPVEGDYDYLFGDTMFRGVVDAAVHAPEEEEAVAPVVDDALHDGETVMTSDVAKLRAKRKPRTSEPPVPPAAQQLVLVLPTGVREPLTQPILVGRNPTVNKVSGGQLPRLLTVGTADQDISRNHAQFSLEGGTVVVTDLHSRNGTSVVMPGKSPQKLRAGEPTSVIVGTVVDLGGGIEITVDEDQ